MKSSLLSLIPIMLGWQISARAVQIAADPFSTGPDPAAGDYSEGTNNLIGQAPDIVGFSGAWLPAYGGAQSPDVASTGLSYPDLPVGGGMVRYAGGGSGRCGRVLTNPYTAASEGTVYIGFLLQLESTSAGYQAVELHQGGFDDGSHRTLQVAVSEPAGGLIPEGEFGLRVNQTDATGRPLGATDTDVNLFILRIDFSTDPNGDSIRIYRNPADLTTEENNTPSATVSGIDFRFDRISLARFNGVTGFSFDQLRVATRFNDITGTVDPDADGDGMDDGWESIFMVDDPGGDPDGDGLTNLEEFGAGTNPREADSDGDMIGDRQELDGSGNPFDNAPTDPSDPDSDDDGLGDGAEVSGANGFVTNPNAGDSDGDGEDDRTEIDEGTDPLDPDSNSAALGNFIVDGKLDSLYGAPLAIQTVETGFGDNMNELDAAYAAVKGDSLYLLLTGNLEANFNKLEIFIDSNGGGSSTFASAGNDNTGGMDGLRLDSGFAIDRHLIVRRGSSKLDFDFADLNARQYASYLDVFGGADEGKAYTGAPTDSTFATPPSPIGIAYDDSNTAGVGGDSGAAADQIAAAAVTTGLELCIRLSDLGAPPARLRICTFINNSEHSFASNQFLGGLPVGSPNLEDPVAIDLNNIPGDQFFAVPIPREPTRILSIDYADTTGEVSLTFSSEPGCQYLIECSPDLAPGWVELDDSYPADDGETTTFRTTLAAPATARKFFRVTPLPK